MPSHAIRNHLRQFCTLRGLTQQALADRVAVTRQTILSIERGRYNPSVDLALRLARAFGVGRNALRTRRR